MKIFSEYILSRLKVIIFYVIIFAVFGTVFALSEIPLDAVVYAASICTFFALIFAVCDFLLFYKRHRTLLGILPDVDIDFEAVPSSGSLIFRDYYELLKELGKRKNACASAEKAYISEMTDYYTVWAHQIKTPIAAMDLLLQSGNADEHELSAELFKINEYVDMVLNYLRASSESTDFVLKNCDIYSAVCQSVRNYRKLFITKKLSLSLNEFHYTVLTDEKWLVFIIGQLLSNALKYTKSGEISIYLEGDSLVIKDTGIGISESDLPRIFEKGFTGYNGRSDKKATGIGLYLCRKISVKLGMDLTVRSKAGCGTAVSLLFDKTAVVPND